MYPPGIVTRTCTVGGATAQESGDPLILSVVVASSRGLIWASTGWRLPSLPRLIASTVGSEATFELPVTSQAGYRSDGSPGTIIDVSAPGSYSHTYTATVTITTPAGKLVSQHVIGPFALPAGDLSPVDLDTMLPVGTVAGGAVLVPGTWDARVAAAEAVIAAITPAGQAITQADDARAQRAALSAPSILRARLMAASEAAFRHDTPTVMASPPTMTTGTATLDAALTRQYNVVTTPGAFSTAGGAPTITSVNFWTFPVTKVGTGNGNLGGGNHALGYAVEFFADCDVIELMFLRGTTPTAAMIEVDGQMLQASPIPWTASGSTMYVRLVFPTRAIRRFRAEADQYGGWRGVNVGPTASVWSANSPDRIVAAWIGDSITAQTGVSVPNGGYAITAGKLVGWNDVREIAHEGSGYTVTGLLGTTFGSAQRVADAAACNPDILVIPSSGNDNNTADATITAAARAAWQAYRAALPDVPIIIGGLFPGAGGPSVITLAKENLIKAAFDAWADPNSHWVPISTDPAGAWLSGTGRVGATTGGGNSDIYISTDGVHPNQAGHDYYGRRWAGAIRSIINGAGL